MKNCLDCLYCKISRPKGILWCSEGEWKKEDDEPKIIILTSQEIHTTYISHRKIFLSAIHCPSMFSMC